jgi:hypothetical protein
MKHKFEAVKEGQSYTLYKDGVQSFCPKLQPMPVQNQYTGGIDWTRFPCNTQCPFASIVKKSHPIQEVNGAGGVKQEYFCYTIKCEGANVEHVLEDLNSQEEQSSILIK